MSVSEAQLRVLEVLADGEWHTATIGTGDSEIHGGAAKALHAAGLADVTGGIFFKYRITEAGRVALERARSRRQEQTVPAEKHRSFTVPLRHKAPCGATCSAGSANGDGYTFGEEAHDGPWEGPPETDGHYHGKCPNGCFKDCCKPAGNLCGPKCQRCFGCRVCGYVHDPGTRHLGMYY